MTIYFCDDLSDFSNFLISAGMATSTSGGAASAVRRKSSRAAAESAVAVLRAAPLARAVGAAATTAGPARLPEGDGFSLVDVAAGRGRTFGRARSADAAVAAWAGNSSVRARSTGVDLVRFLRRQVALAEQRATAADKDVADYAKWREKRDKDGATLLLRPGNPPRIRVILATVVDDKQPEAFMTVEEIESYVDALPVGQIRTEFKNANGGIHSYMNSSKKLQGGVDSELRRQAENAALTAAKEAAAAEARSELLELQLQLAEAEAPRRKLSATARRAILTAAAAAAIDSRSTRPRAAAPAGGAGAGAGATLSAVASAGPAAAAERRARSYRSARLSSSSGASASAASAGAGAAAARAAPLPERGSGAGSATCSAGDRAGPSSSTAGGAESSASQVRISARRRSSARLSALQAPPVSGRDRSEAPQRDSAATAPSVARSSSSAGAAQPAAAAASSAGTVAGQTEGVGLRTRRRRLPVSVPALLQVEPRKMILRRGCLFAWVYRLTTCP